MARELGMNPRKLGSLADGGQEPWKLPLPASDKEDGGHKCSVGALGAGSGR
jgi:hypothetical protein